jgi:hypothetical protein
VAGDWVTGFDFSSISLLFFQPESEARLALEHALGLLLASEVGAIDRIGVDHPLPGLFNVRHFTLKSAYRIEEVLPRWGCRVHFME